MRKKIPLFCLFLLPFFLFAGCNSLYLPQAAQSEVPSFKPKKPIRTVLVLGGGGSRGLALLGAIKELEEAGVRPDLIIGCSAGAVIGAFYADDPNLNGIEKAFLSLKKNDLLDFNFLKLRFGLVEGKALQKFIGKNLHSKTFDELKIPLIVVATDLFTGETIELSQGEIPVSVNASCAFPGIFKPVLLHNRYLIDGGVSSPIPIEIAKKYGAEIIIAIDISEKLPVSKPYHLFGVAKRGMEIIYQKFTDQSLALADISIKMDFQDVGIFSDHLNHQIYEHGRMKVRSMLPEIKKKLANSKE